MEIHRQVVPSGCSPVPMVLSPSTLHPSQGMFHSVWRYYSSSQLGGVTGNQPGNRDQRCCLLNVLHYTGLLSPLAQSKIPVLPRLRNLALNLEARSKQSRRLWGSSVSDTWYVSGGLPSKAGYPGTLQDSRRAVNSLSDLGLTTLNLTRVNNRGRADQLEIEATFLCLETPLPNERSGKQPAWGCPGPSPGCAGDSSHLLVCQLRPQKGGGIYFVRTVLGL